MNTLKLKKSLEEIQSLTESEEKLFEIAGSLSEQSVEYSSIFSKACKMPDTNNLWNFIKSSESSVTSKVNNTIRISRISQLSRSSRAIEETLSRIELPITQEALFDLEAFIHSIDAQFDTPNLQTSIELTHNARNFITSFEKITATLNTLKSTIAKDLDNESPSLAIYFPEEISLEDYSKKLHALSTIIEIAANILKMSSLEAEVRIEKIESGSFFAKISANPVVILLATALITNGSAYYFNNLNPQKNTGAIKESSEALETILNIRNTLRENGVDTKELDENIKSATISIAKNINDLIGSSQKIEINETSLASPHTNPIGTQPRGVLENRTVPNKESQDLN